MCKYVHVYQVGTYSPRLRCQRSVALKKRREHSLDRLFIHFAHQTDNNTPTFGRNASNSKLWVIPIASYLYVMVDNQSKKNQKK